MRRVFCAACLCCAALAACSGGGPNSGALPAPNATPTIGTGAGTVVDDPSGEPLQDVSVQLDPWIAFPTPGPTPTPIQTTTTDSNGRFAFTMPFGTYMLVIGDDIAHTPPPSFTTPAPDATDTPVPGTQTWRATIHDRIVFRGQTTLSAPILPAQPFDTPPAVERQGAYRLSTLDPLTEVPCYLAYNQDRRGLGLPPAVADEWLTENVRAMLGAAQNPNAAGMPLTFLTAGTGHSSNAGGSNCAYATLGGATGDFQSSSQALLPNAQWFAGIYAPASAAHSAFGFAEFPDDPRIDAQNPPWP